MRTHRENPVLMRWDGTLLAKAVSVEALCAARMEAVSPVGAGIDLTFSIDDRIAVVPFVIVRAEEIEERENSPFVWPELARAVDEREIARIEALLLPWVESLTLAQPFFGEVYRIYRGEEFRSLFEGARRAGFLGASPYERVAIDVAPYVYASRFAKDARVRIRDQAASLGAALLHKQARDVQADLGSPHLNQAAAHWYGRSVFGAASGPCDLSVTAQGAQPIAQARTRVLLDDSTGGHVVELAQPIPSEIVFSFDPQDGAIVRRFTVQCDANLAPRAAGITSAVPVGGSAGRILLLMRDDWREADDADSDDALALSRMLIDEGFRVDLAAAGASREVAHYDLVHAFGATHAAQFSAPLRAARAAGIPVVLTPMLYDVAAEGVWGTAIVPILLRSVRDELDNDEYLRMLKERRLQSETVNPGRQEPYAGYSQMLGEVLSLADALVVCGPEEEAYVRGLGCLATAVTAAPHIMPDEAAAVEHVVGTGAYVLIHAPVEPRNNQYLVIRAAMQAGLAVVLAGPIRDFDYYRAICGIADERVAFVPKVDTAFAQGLYRRASVYADFSWISYGLARAGAAGAAGCALAVSQRSYGAKLWAGQVWTADVASVDSMANALDAAWRAAEGSRSRVDAAAARIAAWATPADAFRGTVRAYAAAQQTRSPA